MRAKQERDEERQMVIYSDTATLRNPYYHSSQPGCVGKQANDRDTASRTTHMKGPRKSPKMHKAFPRDEVSVSKGAKFSFFLCTVSMYRDDARNE